MSWNGSDGSVAKTPIKKKVKTPSAMRGIFAGLVVVAFACGGLFYLLSGDKETRRPTKETKKPMSIAEVKPAPATKSEQEEKVTPEDEYIVVNGKKVKLAADPRTGKPKYDKNIRIIPMRASDIKPKRFEYEAEEMIASILEIEPGTPMYGEIPFGKRFKDSLVNSLTTPVEIKPTDDPYLVELKKNVQSVKDDFKKLLLEGGDPAEEMRKARQELIQLGQYRTQLIGELNTLRKSGEYTSQDMKDFLQAANKMMSDKGLKPITMPAILLRNMELKERKIKNEP